MGGYFDEEVDPDESRRKADLLDYLKLPGASEEFRTKFLEMMSDSNTTFVDKYTVALDREPASEEAAREYIESWWQLAFDEPWARIKR
jgi:hypothetical protein